MLMLDKLLIGQDGRLAIGPSGRVAIDDGSCPCCGVNCEICSQNPDVDSLRHPVVTLSGVLPCANFNPTYDINVPWSLTYLVDLPAGIQCRWSLVESGTFGTVGGATITARATILDIGNQGVGRYLGVYHSVIAANVSYDVFQYVQFCTSLVSPMPNQLACGGGRVGRSGQGVIG